MRYITIFIFSAVAADCWASQTLGTALGIPLGRALGGALGAALPAGIGGIAVIAGLGLVVGTQLIKRK